MPYLSSNVSAWASSVTPSDEQRLTRLSDARIARTSGDRLRAARTEARRLETGVALDYIPQGQRWRCQWISNSITDILHDPARGDLLWVGIAAPPLSARALFDTKLYVTTMHHSGSIRLSVYLRSPFQGLDARRSRDLSAYTSSSPPLLVLLVPLQHAQSTVRCRKHSPLLLCSSQQ